MRFRSIIIVMAMAISATTPVFAHAVLLESSPENGAKVAGEAVTIHLRFGGRIDPRLSSLKLIKPDESEAALTMDSVASQDVLQAKAANLPDGPYRIRWQTLSVDGHIDRGEIKFRVGH